MDGQIFCLVAAVIVAGASCTSRDEYTPYVQTPVEGVSTMTSHPDAVSTFANPPVGRPGTEVKGSRVSIPPHVIAGEMLKGKAPSGSHIEAFGQRIQADTGGNFYLQTPDIPGVYSIRVYRPSRKKSLTIHIEVIAAGSK